jgi:hypothetical protein
VQRQPVQSRALRSVGYDLDAAELEIEFSSGQVYCYERVPPSVYHWLLRASNKGIYVSRQIVGRYAERAISGAAPEHATPPDALEQALRDSLARR